MLEKQKNLHAFSLIELLVVISIAIILFTIAIPSYREFVQTNTLVSQNNMLLAALHYTRSEAVKRGTITTLCVHNGSNKCATGAINWADGWIVFEDADKDAVIDSGEKILRIFMAIKGDNALTFSLARNNIHFNNQGAAEINGTFTFCDSRGAGVARGLAIVSSGRIEQAVGSFVCP
jgi:type IV fimbrial biogenesis protein FimT